MIRAARLLSITLQICFTTALGVPGLAAQNAVPSNDTALSKDTAPSVTAPSIEGTVVAGVPFARSKVVVYLDTRPGADQPEDTGRQVARIEMRERRFFPDTLVVPTGTQVFFENLDRVFHNVFSLSKAASFDLGSFSRNAAAQSVVFREPGITFVNCRLHPNMTAAILVAPTPWATVADAGGHFSLADVPPGAYTLVAWHRTAGYFRQQVRVTESGTAHVTVVIPSPPGELASAGSRRAGTKTAGM